MKEYKGHEINTNIIMAYSVQSFLGVPIFMPMSCFNVVYDAACFIVCIVMLHFCQKTNGRGKKKQPDTVNCCLHACFPLILENTCLHPAEWHKAISLMVNSGKSLETGVLGLFRLTLCDKWYITNHLCSLLLIKSKAICIFFSTTKALW